MLRSNFLIGIVIFAIGQTVFAGNSLADYKPGFYIGGQAGFARTNEGSGPEDMMNILYNIPNEPRFKNMSKGRFGGRLFVGYSFLPYFSLDSDFTLYPSNVFKATGEDDENVKYTYSFKTNFYTIDLMVKGVLPLERVSSVFTGWNMYAKLGAAITRVKYNRFVESEANVQSDAITNTSIRPCYALGLGYNFTDNFGVDLSWSGVYSRNKIELIKIDEDYNMFPKGKIPSANLIALGITYKF